MANKKKRDALAGVNMAMALDDQSARDLANLKRFIKKPTRSRVRKQEFDVRKPGAFGVERNTIMKARFGGKVVQKMQDGGAKLSQEEIDAVIREIGEQGTVFGKGRELSKDQTKKIADKFEADFAKMFGKRFGGAIRKMRKGGLMEAIRKVQAKEMELGGDVPKPKPRPKSLKADKTESLDKEFSKKVSRINKKNMETVKGNLNKLKGSKESLEDNEDIFKKKVKKMQGGGEPVPPKFKGFSKLPEKVQQKIDEDLADKYEMGGKVEKYGAGGNVKGGKMGCRGMGAALRGGGFSIR